MKKFMTAIITVIMSLMFLIVPVSAEEDGGWWPQPEEIIETDSGDWIIVVGGKRFPVRRNG